MEAIPGPVSQTKLVELLGELLPLHGDDPCKCGGGYQPKNGSVHHGGFPGPDEPQGLMTKIC